MIRIFSDGGADNRGNAGAACIIKTADQAHCFSFYLGHGTNNEGEIFAALAGFAFVEYLQEVASAKIEWVSDSEYALKSATQYIFNWERNGWKTSQKEPVKNQGLWRTYLSLTRGKAIKATHVKGHSGHLENEACDQAVTWVRMNAERFSNDKSNDGWIEDPIDIGENEYPNWCAFDARVILKEIRSHEDRGIQRDEFVESINFDLAKDILSRPSFFTENVGKTDQDLKPVFQKHTKSFLKKLSSLDKDGSFIKGDNHLKKALDELKAWLKQ